MRNSSNARTNIAIFLAILLLSAGTMVWLFWHHPLTTSIATLAVLTLLGVSARLARSIEAEAEQDSDEPPGVRALDASHTISR
jgi:hypothetical protein